MMEFFTRFPNFNAFFLGLLQGIAQGPYLKNLDPQIFIVVDKNMVFLLFFGLFAPPVLTWFSIAILKTKYHPIWDKMNRYVNMYHLVFWSGISFAIAHFYLLQESSSQIGYGFCVFSSAAGVGFILVGQMEKPLRKKYLSE